MNYIGNIILIAVLTHFIIDLFSEYLNFKNFKRDIPEGFEVYFDEGKYKKSQDYTKTNTQFGIVSGCFDLFIFITFWFLGGFGYLDSWVRGFGLAPVITGIVYISILILARGILEIPFSYYKTFIIEEEFGFNKTTLNLYILDKLKMILVSALIGLPLIAAILSFFEYAKSFAWLLCWIVVSFFMLTMQIIFPVLIMPLFNKFTPLEEGELKEAVLNYAKENDFPLENVYVMDGSKRSGKSNAFFSGFGKGKKLVLFDTIIENHSVDEIVSIIAHETGHFKEKHILTMTALGIIQSGIMFFLLSLFISFKDLFTAFHVEEVSVYAGIVLFGMLYSPVDFFVGLFMLIISRRNEYQADEYAIKTIKDSQSLIDTLKKLCAHNYSDLTPHPLKVFLTYSHPPIIERIKRIKSIKESL